MDEIALTGIEFFANHGFYDEEQKVGNRYVVDVRVKADLELAGESDSLPRTINYEKIYRVVKKVMDSPARLLEHLAYKIILEIKEISKEAKYIEVTVSKHNPPVGGICEKASVTLRREY